MAYKRITFYAAFLLAISLLLVNSIVSSVNYNLGKGGEQVHLRQAFYNLATSLRFNLPSIGAEHKPTVKWQKEMGGRLLLAVLREDGGEVYISLGDNITVLNTDGQIRWSRQFDHMPIAMVASDNGQKLYMVDAASELIALDYAGNTLWHKLLESRGEISSIGTTSDGEHLFAISTIADDCSRLITIIGSSGKVESAFTRAVTADDRMLNVHFYSNGKLIYSRPGTPFVADKFNKCFYQDSRSGYAGDFKLYDHNGALLLKAARRDWMWFEYSDIIGSLPHDRLPGPEWENYFTGGVTPDGNYVYAQDRIYDVTSGKIVWQTPTPSIEATVIYSDFDGFVVQSWGVDIGAPSKLMRINHSGQILWKTPVYGHSIYCNKEHCFVPRIYPWHGCDIYDVRTGRRTKYIPTDFDDVKYASSEFYLGTKANWNNKSLRIYLHNMRGSLLWRADIPLEYKDSINSQETFAPVQKFVPNYQVSFSGNLRFILLKSGRYLALYENIDRGDI